jgi:hypothetical protein
MNLSQLAVSRWDDEPPERTHRHAMSKGPVVSPLNRGRQSARDVSDEGHRKEPP